MRRLFLIRHAKAEPHVGHSDYERRLTGRGRDDAKRVANALAARRMLPDILIHSGAARAKETAEIFAAAWRGKVELEEDTGLYDASLATLLDRTRALSDTRKRTGLVGHNPGLGELATALTGPGAQPELPASPPNIRPGPSRRSIFPSAAGRTSSAIPGCWRST